jgi:AraC-like DNA-binding protein
MKLLANPNQSVSEIAYSVGFQALTQFNRLFRRIVGQSPTTFRCSLREASSPTNRMLGVVPKMGAAEHGDYISHRMNEVFELSDMITVMKDGALIPEKVRGSKRQRTL